MVEPTAQVAANDVDDQAGEQIEDHVAHGSGFHPRRNGHGDHGIRQPEDVDGVGWGNGYQYRSRAGHRLQPRQIKIIKGCVKR